MPSKLHDEIKLTMIEAAGEQVIRLASRKCSRVTVWRWCKYGVEVKGAGRIKLESVRLPGGQIVTSREALHRFVAITNGITPVTIKSNRTSIQARQKLVRLGLLDPLPAKSISAMAS